MCVYLKSPPAARYNVGSQSIMCIRCSATRPRPPAPPAASNGLHTNAAPRTPPSHSVFFTPRSGQFEAALMLNPSAAPPLSVLNTTIVFSSMPAPRSASVTAPTDRSRCTIIAGQKPR